MQKDEALSKRVSRYFLPGLKFPWFRKILVIVPCEKFEWEGRRGDREKSTWK